MFVMFMISVKNSPKFKFVVADKKVVRIRALSCRVDGGVPPELAVIVNEYVVG